MTPATSDVERTLAVELIMRTSMIQTFWSDESGATMVEYGLMVALIAVAVVGAIGTFGRAIRDNLFQVAGTMFQSS